MNWLRRYKWTVALVIFSQVALVAWVAVWPNAPDWMFPVAGALIGVGIGWVYALEHVRGAS